MADTEFKFLDDDEEFPFFPQDEARGMRVSRYGTIQAADPIKALAHPSVPAVGDKFAEQMFLFVKSRRVMGKLGGRVGSGDGPVYKLEIAYETPTWSGAGILRATTPGESWTEVTTGNTNLTIYTDVVADDDPNARRAPIAGGDGATIEIGTVEASVKVWYNRAGFANVDVGRLVTLAKGGVNAAPVVLPNLIGSGVSLNMARGQVRYRSFGFLRDGEFFGVEHRLALAPDFLIRVAKRDGDGMMTGVIEEHTGYLDIDLGGLW